MFSLRHAFYSFCILFFLSLISGCATNSWEKEVVSSGQQAWFNSIVNYQSESKLPANDKLSPLSITNEMRSIVNSKFSKQRKSIAVENLARWLMSPEGHGMQYDLNANLTPIEAFEQKRGNCLSFTMLLVNLAKVIDVELEYNDVYLPNFWGMEDEQSNIVLLRHVNAIRKSFDRTQIFDLAIEQYDYGFPQKTITEQQALAWLYSNLSIEKLNNNNLNSALHHIKKSISLFPKNSDFWVNLGVIYKKNGDFINSEPIR